MPGFGPQTNHPAEQQTAQPYQPVALPGSGNSPAEVRMKNAVKWGFKMNDGDKQAWEMMNQDYQNVNQQTQQKMQYDMQQMQQQRDQQKWEMEKRQAQGYTY